MKSSNPLDVRTYRYKADIAGKEPLLGNPDTDNQFLKSTEDGERSWKALNSTDVGLGDVDNTSDADKPISTDTQDALDDKLSKNGYTGDITVVTSVDFDAKTTTTKTITYTDGQITDVS